MKPKERQQQILSRLRAIQRDWRVEEIAAALKVSPLTIRRDLDRLASAGSILRTHGGCIYAGRQALETQYHQRVATNFELKQAIGRAAANEVKAGDVILISDGSTCFHLAAHLGTRGPLVVYTNSIAMIPEFTREPNIRLYIVGGEFHRDLFFLGGSLTERVLETVDFDAVFLGADALDAAGRCRVHDQETARATQLMLRRGRRTILLADHTKVTTRASVSYGTLSDFDLWITTPGLSAAQRKQYSQMTKIKEIKP